MSQGIPDSVGQFASAAKKDAVQAADAAWNGLKSLATDEAAREQAWEAVQQAIEAAQRYAGQVYDDPAKAYRDAKDGANRLYSLFDAARREAAAKGGSPEFWDDLAGKAASEIGATLIPIGIASKAGKLAEAVTGLGALDSVADLTQAARRAIDVAEQVAKLPGSPAASGCKAAGAALATAKSLSYLPTSGVPIVPTLGKTTTILGKYAQDMKNVLGELDVPKGLDFGPKPGGFNVLNVPDALYKSPQQFWDECNKPFLDRIIERGDEIVMATRPTAEALADVVMPDGSLVKSGLAREIEYLKSKGYIYDAAKSAMKRVR